MDQQGDTYAHVNDLCESAFLRRDHEHVVEADRRRRFRKWRLSEKRGREKALAEAAPGSLDIEEVKEPTTKTTTNLFARRKRPRFELPVLSDSRVCELKAYLNQIDSRLKDPSREDCRWFWGSAEYSHLKRGIVNVNYAERNYSAVRKGIELMGASIPYEWDTEMEALWHNSAYNMRLNNDPNYNLTAVNKYRIRKRAPCPTEKRGGGKKYSISMEAISIMIRHYEHNPRPDTQTRLSIAEKAYLPYKTVSNWFKNRRQRVMLEYRKKEAARLSNIDECDNVPEMISKRPEEILETISYQPTCNEMPLVVYEESQPAGLTAVPTTAIIEQPETKTKTESVSEPHYVSYESNPEHQQQPPYMGYATCYASNEAYFPYYQVPANIQPDLNAQMCYDEDLTTYPVEGWSNGSLPTIHYYS